MSGKNLAITVSITTAIVGLAAFFAFTPIKQVWYKYLNGYATEYYVSQVVVFNARKDLNLPDGAALFYGDSLVQGLALSNASNRAVNYGIGHATSKTVVLQLQKHRNTSNAAVIILAVGINDIIRGNADQVLPAYHHAVKIIPEGVPVIISKLMPVSEAELRRPGISEKIIKVNRGLDELCTTTPLIHCLDTGRNLSLPNGQLDSRYHIGDGLHLNAWGNSIWLKQLKSVIEKVTKTPAKTEKDLQDGLSK